MSALIDALLEELDDQALDRLAERLAPRLAALHAQEQASGSPWLRGAPAIAEYCGCPESRVYALSSAGRIPVEHDGRSLLARRADLDRWLEAGGAKRP